MDITKLTGFTPGPLHVTGGYVLTWDFESTADCYMGKPATDQRNANAELYAIAPDLLTIAKMGLELAEMVERDGRGLIDGPTRKQMAGKARALRAKAGE